MNVSQEVPEPDDELRQLALQIHAGADTTGSYCQLLIYFLVPQGRIREVVERVSSQAYVMHIRSATNQSTQVVKLYKANRVTSQDTAQTARRPSIIGLYSCRVPHHCLVRLLCDLGTIIGYDTVVIRSSDIRPAEGHDLHRIGKCLIVRRVLSSAASRTLTYEVS